MHSLRAVVLALALAACIPAVRPAGPARESVGSLWDFAPRDASDGVVFHPGAFARALALLASLRAHETPHPELDAEPPDHDGAPPLRTAADWERAGLDPGLDGAAFSWRDRDRGALLIMPVGDRDKFRAAFKAKTRTDGGREIDEVINGYACVRAVGRVLCAKRVEDIDLAAARHSSPVAYGGEHLDADDTGDIEIFATPAAPNVTDMAQKMRHDYGKVAGVASAVRLRPDGASLRVHVKGDLRAPLASGLGGTVPAKGRPLPAGAPTALRVHVDPSAILATLGSLDDDDKHEFVEQLTGDIEATTSGRGLIGVNVALDVRVPARVEAYVKNKCADAGSYALGTGLRGITVTDHGCAAVFDSKLALLPVALDPIPVSVEVHGAKLLVSIGDARAPSSAERTTAAVATETDAAFAVADREAIVAFTKSPWIGPDLGAGDAFRRMFWMIGERTAARIDRFNDVAAHIAQAFTAARVDEGGVVLQAGFVTFDHDGPEVANAYGAALDARARGDVAAYRARLTDIERRFPASLAAQRAAELRKAGPYVGAGAVSLGLVGVWLQALDSLLNLAKQDR